MKQESDGTLTGPQNCHMSLHHHSFTRVQKIGVVNKTDRNPEGLALQTLCLQLGVNRHSYILLQKECLYSGVTT